jgi:predicted MPP superfamily phosphohydrolase
MIRTEPRIASNVRAKATFPRVKVVLLALLLIVISLLVWSLVIEPNRLVLKTVLLPVERIDKHFGPLRVVLISDLHAGSPWITLEKLREVVSITNAAKPDLILLAGDFVAEEVIGGSLVEPEPIAAELKALSAPLGTYAVLGNHDWAWNGYRVSKALTDAGIPVLENSALRLERDGRHLWLVGIADAWTRRPDFQTAMNQIQDDAPVIAFTHNPDVFPYAPKQVDLTLAGHTHGGQICLPFIGSPMVPSKYGQRYVAGHTVENGHDLYVTTGIGTSVFPIRLGVTPEVVLLSL